MSPSARTLICWAVTWLRGDRARIMDLVHQLISEISILRSIIMACVERHHAHKFSLPTKLQSQVFNDSPDELLHLKGAAASRNGFVTFFGQGLVVSRTLPHPEAVFIQSKLRSLSSPVKDVSLQISSCYECSPIYTSSCFRKLDLGRLFSNYFSSTRV